MHPWNSLSHNLYGYPKRHIFHPATVNNDWPSNLNKKDKRRQTDQDTTWYGGKPRPRRRCIRCGRSFPLKGAQPPVLGPCLLWPNGWMDEDASWYGSRPWPRPHCFWRSPAKGAQQLPFFSAHVYCGHGRPSQLLLSSCNFFFIMYYYQVLQTLVCCA